MNKKNKNKGNREMKKAGDMKKSDEKDAKKQRSIEKIVPDTSVIIEGLLSKRIEAGELRPRHVIIHEAVVAELEHQANQNRETGYIGIEEITKLREISKKYNFNIIYSGKRPAEFEIKHAKAGEIDSIIRELAQKEHATLMTADQVQALVAQSKGIPVILIEFEKVPKKIKLESYFDETTMSVHLKEKVLPAAKRGMPGKWDFVIVGKDPLTRDEMKDMAKEIVEEANMREDGFIEIQRKGSTIIQLGNFRIVIARPPFADGHEITAVRPVKKMSMGDYALSDKLKKRIEVQAEGILIAGSPGMGKSTFAQALAEDYASKDKIVKTVEAPRDLQLPDSVTQYAISHGSPQEIHDILLLTRPDYTIFDEMRNTEDFKLFADMRLAGVGMVGVVHATNPIDAIQRFIGRIELGVIPQVIDTVIFIKDGKVNKVFNVRMDVKVPSGMTEADLARPIVTVSDFETGKLEFEIYSYGEETVVVPVKMANASGVYALAAESIKREFGRYTSNVKVDLVSSNKAIVYVPEHDMSSIIGRQGQTIDQIEKRLGISISLEPLGKAKERPSDSGSDGQSVQTGSGKTNVVRYEAQLGKKGVVFFLDKEYADSDIDVLVGEDYLLTVKSSKKSIVKIKKDNKIGKILIEALMRKEKVRLMG